MTYLSGELHNITLIWKVLHKLWLTLNNHAEDILKTERLVLGNVNVLHALVLDLCLLAADKVLKMVDSQVIEIWEVTLALNS